MKTKYKYIHFDFEASSKTWQCWANKPEHYLGFVEWEKLWREWQYVPADHTAYTQTCLLDIADFMSQLEKPQ